MTPIPLPPPFVPSQECRIDSWSTPNSEFFSYEFTYEAELLTGMRMSSPSSPWPMRYAFGYTDERLSRITQLPENDFPDYDSLLTTFTFDNRGRPIYYSTTTFLNGEATGEVNNTVEYNDYRFIVQQEGLDRGPYELYLLDISGNIERLEEYDESGALFRIQDGTFDDRPSPFKNFPPAFKLYFRPQIGLSWNNNVTRTRCEDVPNREVIFKRLDYSYNDAGYPTESRTEGEFLVYRMRYGKCE